MDENKQESVTPTEEISDGYHTFKELYQYRRVYNAMLVNEYENQWLYNVHKSLKHSDWEDCFGGGYFVVQMTLPTGQVSNHYKLEHWDEFKCEIRGKADEWDGHTPQEALSRMMNFLK